MNVQDCCMRVKGKIETSGVHTSLHFTLLQNFLEALKSRFFPLDASIIRITSIYELTFCSKIENHVYMYVSEACSTVKVES